MSTTTKHTKITIRHSEIVALETNGLTPGTTVCPLCHTVLTQTAGYEDTVYVQEPKRLSDGSQTTDHDDK